jgi:poly-gamma-glutamate synthesis protein (capsule biosynthesis protein)
MGCALCTAVILVQQLPLPTFAFTSGWFASDQYEGPLVLFTGDVFLGRAVERSLSRNPEKNVFSYLEPLLHLYSEVVVNFEAAVPENHQPTPDFGFQFSVSEASLNQLTNVVTAASLANNHSLDFGMAGYKHTRMALQAMLVSPFGHPRDNADYYVTNTEPRIAVIGLNQVGATVATSALTSLINRAHAEADYVVAYVHWGEEYTTEISPAQQQLTDFLVTEEVPLVIGHHPHVVQPIRKIDETVIIYSLGNTVFDQYFSKEVQEGLLTGIEATKSGLVLNLYPISSLSSPHQPQLLEDDLARVWLTQLADMSDDSLRSNIITGQIPLLSW